MLICRTFPFQSVVNAGFLSSTGCLKRLLTSLVVGFKHPVFAGIGVCILLLHALTGQAQYDKTIPQIDSSHGYWRLNTQAVTRSTVIQFFGTSKQLLYEEILPGKWVKLSRKNQKQFDRLLEQLLANQLLTSRIKTELLPPTPAETVLPNGSAPSETDSNASPTKTASVVHAYVSQAGKLYLIVNNPDRLRYKIQLIDQLNRTLYEEFNNHPQYRRKLDLSALAYDAYQVIVQIDNKPVIYKIRRQDTQSAYRIQPGAVVSKEAIVEQNPEDNRPLPVPVTIDL